MEFLSLHPEYIHPNAAINWLTDAESRPDHTFGAKGYSTCHFWSNFEIGDMEFWRSSVYQEYFDYLDRKGGFYYERWGDAPVHSIALGLFEDSSKIHWFKDIDTSTFLTLTVQTLPSVADVPLACFLTALACHQKTVCTTG